MDTNRLSYKPRVRVPPSAPFQSCANRIFAAPRIHAPGGFFLRHPMKHSTVIKSSSLPMRSPLGLAILFWLLLDRLGAPG